MRKTLEECKELYKQFEKKWETAEQRQFPLFMVFDCKIQETIENYDKISDEELDIMFRVVNRFI